LRLDAWIEGVTDPLERYVIPEGTEGTEAVAEHLAVSLIARVDVAAQNGVTRDDFASSSASSSDYGTGTSRGL
jgi:hypothetical protein